MAGQYPYPPPPPAPTAAPTSNWPTYNTGAQSYSHTHRGGGSSGPPSRGHGHSQPPANYGYPRQEYPSQAQGSYNHQAPYWNGNPPQSGAPIPQSSYPPNYHPQGYPPQPHPGYQPPAYPSSGQRPPYTPYPPPSATEYPAQQWTEAGAPYGSYSNRGGRGGYSGDRGGARPDHGAHMMHGTQASSGYGQQFSPGPQHAASGYQQPPPYHSYPPAPFPAYPGPAHNTHPNHRERGRDGFSANFRGRHGHERGDKSHHHKGQRPTHNQGSSQKSDNASGKKKKRKTNTLGLTPGDGDESDDAPVDDEKHMEELLGPDAIVPTDIAQWIAERKAKYPTKARIADKKANEQAKGTAAVDDHKPAAKLDEDEEKAEKLRQELAKLERKLKTKRKREANDEGDEMRVGGANSDGSDSEDDKPEVQPTRKQSSFLPPPPITRADPTNHCKYYSTGGVCGKKNKCRFVHDKEVREQALREQAANGGRMTLKQRLLRNDKEQEDLAVIQTIVSLRESGKLPDTHVRRTVTSSLPTSSTRMLPIAHVPNKNESYTTPPSKFLYSGSDIVTTSSRKTRFPPGEPHVESGPKVTASRGIYTDLSRFGSAHQDPRPQFPTIKRRIRKSHQSKKAPAAAG